MINSVTIMGRLTDNPVTRTTTTGKSVVSFSIAYDRGRKDANGNDQTDYFNITAWNKTGEFIGKYFTKGVLIAIRGHLFTRNYTDKNGNKRTSFDIVADEVSFCEKKVTSAPAPASGPAPAAFAAPAANAAPSYSAGTSDDFTTFDMDEGDLPF